MNKIYKVVWSKVRNAYVVVSEIAKSHSKSKAQAGTKVTGGLLRLAVVSSLFAGSILLNPMSVDAAWGSGQRTGSDNDTLAAGTTAKANGGGAVALGPLLLPEQMPLLLALMHPLLV